jgi:hypothetical protein
MPHGKVPNQVARKRRWHEQFVFLASLVDSVSSVSSRQPSTVSKPAVTLVIEKRVSEVVQSPRPGTFADWRAGSLEHLPEPSHLWKMAL